MNTSHRPADFFRELSARVLPHARGQERVSLSCRGEESTFVRFADGAMRQPGTVQQCDATLTLADQGRATSLRASLSGDLVRDAEILAGALSSLRDDLSWMPEDPHLLLPDAVESSHDDAGARPGAVPIDAGDVCDAVLRLGRGLGFTGILATGEVYAGFADTRGQQNWFSRSPMHLDFSLYAGGPGPGAVAVKGAVAGDGWEEGRFAARLDEMRGQLEVVGRPPMTLSPGEYRAFLAPAALDEFLGVVSWNGFGARARHTRQSALQRMADDDARLHPAVTLREASASGAGPRFGPEGFLRAPEVILVQDGALGRPLVSPRSAREFALVSTGASADEVPQALDMAPGELPIEDALRALDTGLYVGNLWYLNFSDQQACRVTGMTRFATFWVEKGVPVAPVAPMRFDDSIYRMLGTQLEALTREREWLLDANTYEARSTRSSLVPGALLRALRCTL